MYPITRLFESEQAANAAIDALVAGEEPRGRSLVIAASDPNAAAKLDAAIAAGSIEEIHRDALAAGLSRGRTILSSRPSELNTGRFVEQTLNAHCVDRDAIREYIPSNAAPFSDLLGIPVLSDSRSQTELVKFDKDSSFGIKLISHKATPLSSMFGLPVLRASKSAKGTSIAKMSQTSAPFSSKLGMKLLSKSKSAKGTSVARLSRKAAPFSAFLGLRVLSKRD
ncbi:MAG: hypothetical protein AAGJ86_07180 [Pseudomonadota bacterium]